MTVLDLSRWQFGITTVYHFIFVHRPGVSQARAPARRGNGPPRPFGPIIPGHRLRSAPEPEPVPPVPPGLLRRPGRGAEP
jgi:hypothetical protein